MGRRRSWEEDKSGVMEYPGGSMGRNTSPAPHNENHRAPPGIPAPINVEEYIPDKKEPFWTKVHYLMLLYVKGTWSEDTIPNIVNKDPSS